jgi:hypothetical protein
MLDFLRVKEILSKTIFGSIYMNIVFAVDSSPSMGMKIDNGVTLLDCCKIGVSNIIK